MYRFPQEPHNSRLLLCVGRLMHCPDSCYFTTSFCLSFDHKENTETHSYLRKSPSSDRRQPHESCNAGTCKNNTSRNTTRWKSWLTFLLHIRKVPSSNIGHGDRLWGLSWFYSVPPGDCRDITLKFGHDRFQPNSSQFIIHLSPYHRHYRPIV
jgi:hypothetical protein